MLDELTPTWILCHVPYVVCCCFSHMYPYLSLQFWLSQLPYFADNATHLKRFFDAPRKPHDTNVGLDPSTHL